MRCRGLMLRASAHLLPRSHAIPSRPIAGTEAGSSSSSHTLLYDSFPWSWVKFYTPSKGQNVNEGPFLFAFKVVAFEWNCQSNSSQTSTWDSLDKAYYEKAVFFTFNSGLRKLFHWWLQWGSKMLQKKTQQTKNHTCWKCRKCPINVDTNKQVFSDVSKHEKKNQHRISLSSLRKNVWQWREPQTSIRFIIIVKSSAG